MKYLSEDWQGVEKVDGETLWLKGIYEKVFSNFDPFEPRFTVSSTVRFVLYPTDSYHLTRMQYQALLASLSSRDEQRFVVSEIGWGPDSFDKGHHYVCYQLAFESYTSLRIGVENAIYGIDGSWGILVSDELHAILTGDASFGAEFRKNYPSIENDRSAFIEYWEKDELGTEWLAKLVSRLNS